MTGKARRDEAAAPTRGKGDPLEFSQTLFRLRRGLLEHFGRIERELENKFNAGSERFATKDDLAKVIEKMHDFRAELDQVLVQVEDRITHSGESLFKAFARAPAAGDPARAEESSPWDDAFTDLNPFNLRRRYHEMSLRLRSEEVDPFGFDPVFERYVRPLFEFLYVKYFRVETYGMANVPQTGGCLMVGNHSGSLPYDAVMLKMALQREHPARRELRFTVEDFLFHLPFLGSFMNRFGGVRASQENATLLLESGMPVVVFPEGVKGLGKLYRDRYHLARFGRGGFVKLCLRTRAPLVPVAFIGPEEIHPMLYRETFFAKMLGAPYFPVTPTFPWLGPAGLIPLPSKWSIHLLPAIDFSNYGPGAENDRVLVYKMAQQVKSLIQETIIDRLKQRRSVWFG